MPQLIYDDTDEQPPQSSRFHGHRRRPLHGLFGGGRVADILLWRNKYVSAGILAGVTLAWFLFEVVECHFLALLGHLFITIMSVVFIWSNAAAIFDREPPRIPEVLLSEQPFRDAALALHAKFNQFMSFLHDIASGRDLKMFLLAIFALWIISEIGSYCSALSLLYLVFLCLHTLPVLYEHYEPEIDHLATKGGQDLKKIYNKLDSKVLNKIPRGPVKPKDRKFT